MLLRFLQKGLTFHNIPLMPGITAQDDENVVYSKQIGAEGNNGKARRAHVPRSRSPSRRAAGPLLAVPASGHLRPGRAWSRHPGLAGSQESRWPLSVCTSKCHAEAPASPRHAAAFPILKGKNVSFSSFPSPRGRARVKNSGFPPKTSCLTSATRQRGQHSGSWPARCDLEK